MLAEKKFERSMQNIVVGSNAFLSMPIDQPSATSANDLAANGTSPSAGLAGQVSDPELIRALAEALDYCYTEIDNFFAEIVGGARANVHRDHFGANLGKTALFFKVIQTAHNEGWLPAVLKAIERELEPPDGRFRDPGPVQTRLRKATADARQLKPPGQWGYQIRKRPGPAIAAAGVVALALIAWTAFGPEPDPPGLEMAPLATLHFRPMTQAPGPDDPQSTTWTKSPVAVAVQNVTLSAPAESAIAYQIQEIGLVLTINERRLRYTWLQFVSLDEICIALCKTSDVNAFDVSAGGGYSRDVMFAAASKADQITWKDYVDSFRTAAVVSVEVSVKYKRHALGQATRTVRAICAVPDTLLNEFRNHPRYLDRAVYPEFLHVTNCQPSSPS